MSTRVQAAAIPAARNAESASSELRDLAIKVPAITMWFWIIKVLCTTVGETAADYINVNLHLGLNGTSIVTAIALAVALTLQITAKRYVAWRYWLTVTLISVFGTLVTDNLTDNLKVPLIRSTIAFTVVLAGTFLAWFASEKSLSIHSVRTRRREGFYWLAVFVTFALGTASGDLIAERLGFGYLPTGLMIAGIIATAAVLRRFGMNSILTFWVVYILTRPLGASIGDYLSEPHSAGGLGLGTTGTSFLFLGAIAGVVAYLSISKRDVIAGDGHAEEEPVEKGGLWQTAAVVAVLLVGSVVGYSARHNALVAQDASTTTGATKLGDLSSFRTITQDTLDKLTAKDQSGATSRVDDLEREWDRAQARLKAKDTAQWTLVDGKIDTVLKQLRAATPNSTTESAALNDLLVNLK